MRIFIRADTHPNVGMGHVMRCLSIADALKKVGHDVKFILADDSVAELIRERGFETAILGTDYKHMEEELASWPKIEVAEKVERIEKTGKVEKVEKARKADNADNAEKADAVIVDSYFVTAPYLKSLRQFGKKICYIDDLAAFPYPVDILIAYNAYADIKTYQKLYGTTDTTRLPCIIIGPQYAPLREMFQGITPRQQNEVVKEVLVSTGGADFLHLALQFLQYPSLPENFTYHLLIGSLNTDKEEIKKLAAEKSNVVLHENITDMKTLISSMDIAVSAAGSTLYEIAACGVPLITYILADNQIEGAEAFSRLGLAVNVGDLRKLDTPIESILTALKELAVNYEARITMGKQMQSLIDGTGANKLAKDVPINMIDFLDRRQNPLTDISKTDINAWISTLLNYLGGESWLGKNKNHPISKLWDHKNAMSTNELVTFARAISIMESVDKAWLTKTMKLVAGKDLNNAHGAIFEILALSIFKDAKLIVSPASMSCPGIDGYVRFQQDSGPVINLSLKYYGLSKAEQDFQTFMDEINGLIKDTLRAPSVNVFLELKRHVESKADKELLRDLIKKAIKTYNKNVQKGKRLRFDDDLAEIFVQPIQGFRLSQVMKSHQFHVMSPAYRNDDKNLLGKIDEACANILKNKPESGYNGIIIHIHENANIVSYKNYIQKYLNDKPNIPISFVILYQTCIAFYEDNRHGITHCVQIALSPASDSLFSDIIELKNRILPGFSFFVGELALEPIPRMLFINQNGIVTNQVIPNNMYFYQKGEIYEDAYTKPDGSWGGDFRMIAPGLRVKPVFSMPDKQGRVTYATFDAPIPEDDHLEIL